MWLPEPPPEYTSLPHWLSELTDSQLKKLLEQGDSQKVRELSLALITVLNEVSAPPRVCLNQHSRPETLVFCVQYEQSRESTRVSREEHGYRVRVRSNITRALTSLDLSTVSDIQQTSAALAQCTVRPVFGGGFENHQSKTACFSGCQSRVYLRGVSEHHFKQAGVHAGDPAD